MNQMQDKKINVLIQLRSDGRDRFSVKVRRVVGEDQRKSTYIKFQTLSAPFLPLS
jgi:hypothetical protein